MNTRLIYIHVPKCGGSSFGAALRFRHLLSQATIPPQVTAMAPPRSAVERTKVFEADYRERAKVLRRLVARGTSVIAAHVRYDPVLHAGSASGYAHVTMLRDPVDRFVSHYRYLQRRHPDSTRAQTLERFLETTDAERLGKTYLFFFGGPERCTSNAVAALSRFDLVGDLAEPDRFAAGLRAFSGPFLPVLLRNRAPVPSRTPAKLRRRIEALCAQDIEIYEACRALRCRGF